MITKQGGTMARGRMIDKRISKSKKLTALKFERSRTLYFMILPHLDCEGRYSGDPEEIKEDCVPKLRFSAQQVAESIVDLANVSLLLLYEHKEEPFIQYSRFADFQAGIRKDREAPSVIPSPLKIQSSSGVTPSLYLSLKLRLRKEGNVKEEIYFDFEQRKFFFIKIEDKAGWKDAYPVVDIEAQLRIMREWLLANPSRKKSNYRQFINNWLKREQDKGGSRKSFSSGYISKRDRDAKEIKDLANEVPQKEKT